MYVMGFTFKTYTHMFITHIIPFSLFRLYRFAFSSNTCKRFVRHVS